MQIYPAIDIHKGQCVRLTQGDFEQVTIFDPRPENIAKKFAEAGATFLHIVDLDGALQGSTANQEAIKNILASVQIPVQVGGGIRALSQIEEKINLGVSRVILGSIAVQNPDLIKQAIIKFGSKIAVGVDAKDGYVAIQGWKEVSQKKATDLCKALADMGVQTIILTDIAKDGMMQGCNVSFTEEIVKLTGINIIASGGVSTMQDLDQVESCGASGAIVGKALLLGNLDLKMIIQRYELGIK